MKADVVVIGSGFAGLSAAVRLTAAGHSVIVVEEAPRLGGRATAFTDRETGERVDNGQHVLFGCYRETYRFLRRLGTDALAPLQPSLRVSMAGLGEGPFELRCPSIRPPWHLIAGLWRWPALRFRDRWSAFALRTVIADARRVGAAAVAAEVPARQTVAEWLAAHGQSPRLCTWLWYPLAIAALNQSPTVAAAAPFVRVLGELFGPRAEDSAIGVPSVPLDELYAEPARRFVEKSGGRVVLKASARIVADPQGNITGVAAGGETFDARVVVSAVPWHALERLWNVVPLPIAAIVSRANAMASCPIVTVNAWYDDAVTGQPFVGLVDGPMHWVFDKSAILGEQAGHLSIVSSGADAIARMDNAALTDLAVAQLHRALPASRGRRLLRSVVVREPRATFSLAPDQPARPGNATLLPGFYLAGDWTDTGLPGTIESAVQSGHAAADLVIARLGVPHRRRS